MSTVNIDEELIKAKAIARECEVKLNALIDVLAKEGLIVASDVEKEIKRILAEESE